MGKKGMLQDIRDDNSTPFFFRERRISKLFTNSFLFAWTNIIFDCRWQCCELKLHEDPVYSQAETFENPYTSILLAQLPADFDQQPKAFCSLSAGVIYKVHQAKNSK